MPPADERTRRTAGPAQPETAAGAVIAPLDDLMSASGRAPPLKAKDPPPPPPAAPPTASASADDDQMYCTPALSADTPLRRVPDAPERLKLPPAATDAGRTSPAKPATPDAFSGGFGPPQPNRVSQNHSVLFENSQSTFQSSHDDAGPRGDDDDDDDDGANPAANTAANPAGSPADPNRPAHGRVVPPPNHSWPSFGDLSPAAGMAGRFGSAPPVFAGLLQGKRSTESPRILNDRSAANAFAPVGGPVNALEFQDSECAENSQSMDLGSGRANEDSQDSGLEESQFNLAFQASQTQNDTQNDALAMPPPATPSRGSGPADLQPESPVLFSEADQTSAPPMTPSRDITQPDDTQRVSQTPQASGKATVATMVPQPSSNAAPADDADIDMLADPAGFSLYSQEPILGPRQPDSPIAARRVAVPTDLVVEAPAPAEIAPPPKRKDVFEFDEDQDQPMQDAPPAVPVRKPEPEPMPVPVSVRLPVPVSVSEPVSEPEPEPEPEAMEIEDPPRQFVVGDRLYVLFSSGRYLGRITKVRASSKTKGLNEYRLEFRDRTSLWVEDGDSLVLWDVPAPAKSPSPTPRDPEPAPQQHDSTPPPPRSAERADVPPFDQLDQWTVELRYRGGVVLTAVVKDRKTTKIGTRIFRVATNDGASFWLSYPPPSHTTFPTRRPEVSEDGSRSRYRPKVMKYAQELAATDAQKFANAALATPGRLIGSRIRVRWDGGQSYMGTVVLVDTARSECYLVYDDADEETLSLPLDDRSTIVLMAKLSSSNLAALQSAGDASSLSSNTRSGSAGARPAGTETPATMATVIPGTAEPRSRRGSKRRVSFSRLPVGDDIVAEARVPDNTIPSTDATLPLAVDAVVFTLFHMRGGSQWFRGVVCQVRNAIHTVLYSDGERRNETLPHDEVRVLTGPEPDLELSGHGKRPAPVDRDNIDADARAQPRKRSHNPGAPIKSALRKPLQRDRLSDTSPIGIFRSLVFQLEGDAKNNPALLEAIAANQGRVLPLPGKTLNESLTVIDAYNRAVDADLMGGGLAVPVSLVMVAEKAVDTEGFWMALAMRAPWVDSSWVSRADASKVLPPFEKVYVPWGGATRVYMPMTPSLPATRPLSGLVVAVASRTKGSAQLQNLAERAGAVVRPRTDPGVSVVFSDRPGDGVVSIDWLRETLLRGHVTD